MNSASSLPEERVSTIIDDVHLLAYLMRTPIDRRKACVNASVLLISNEKISLPDMAVNGVSDPNAWAIPSREHIHEHKQRRRVVHSPMAMAVLPVPG